MAATWPWVSGATLVRSPSGGVSGPMTAIQILSEPCDLGAVALPFDRGVSAAVVGGHDHRGRAAIVGHRLHGVPQVPQVKVGVLRGAEILVVAPACGRIRRSLPGRCIAPADAAA